MKRNYIIRAAAAAMVLSLAVAPCAYARVDQPSDPSQTGMTTAQLNGYTDEQWAAITDNHLDWGEIRERVKNFNPSLASGWSTYTDTLNNMKISQQILQDADKTSKDIVKSYEKMPVSVEQQMMLQYSKLSQQAVAQTKTSISNTVTAMNRDGSKYSRQLDKAADQLTTAVQSLIIGYKTIVAQKATLTTLSDLYRQSYDATAALIGQGLATTADLVSAQSNMLSAQSNLATISASEGQLYKQILILCGYNETDAVTIGDVPGADAAKIASYNPDADYGQAVANSTAVGEAMNADHKHTDTGVELWDSNADTTKRLVHVKLVSLYDDVIATQQQLQAAQVGYQAALESKKLADIQKKQGLITDAQYLGQTISVVQKQAEVTSSNLALVQAMITYESALEGNCSVD